ncbi:MAG: alpha/beta fold hydrolase [Pseudomonadota bacterium]
MRVIITGLLLIILASRFSVAQTERPPLEAYGTLPQISSADLSPDGKHIAFIGNVEGTTRLLVSDLNGNMIKAVGLEDVKARYATFLNNEQVVLRASDTVRTFGFRGEYEYSGAFVLPVYGNGYTQLLKGTKGIFPAQGGLGRIVGSADKDNHVLMPAFMGSAGYDPDKDLLKVNLKTGRGRSAFGGNHHTKDWFTNGAGDVLVREDYNNKTNTYRLIHYLPNGDMKTLLEVKAEIPPVSILGVMPDQTGLVYIANSRDGAGYDRLMKLGFDGTKSQIIEDKDLDIAATLTDRERRVVAVRYAGPSPTYAFIDESLGAVFARAEAKLPSASLYLDSWSDDKSVLLMRAFDGGLGDVWLTFDAKEDAFALVGRNRPDIPAEALGTILTIEYQARDGLTIPAIVTIPPGIDYASNPKLPTIVLPHGGPASHDTMDFDWMAQYFANRGYLVLQPNFRGSTGYGRAFQDAGDGEWGGKMQDDLTDGLTAIDAAGLGDKSRACIVGWSYGGYAALAGGAFTPDLFKCVVAGAGVSDLNMMLKNTKRERGRDHWAVSYWERVMADGDARRKKLKEISPVQYAEAFQAPVLLIHGDDDTVVDIGQSRAMERALKRAKKSVEFVRLRKDDHWLSVDETRIEALRAMDTFLAKHLPPAP